MKPCPVLVLLHLAVYVCSLELLHASYLPLQLNCHHGWCDYFWGVFFLFLVWFVCLCFFLTRKKNKDLKFYGVCVCMCGFPGKSALQFKSEWSVLVMPVPTAAASASSSFRTKLNWTWEDGKLLVQRKGTKPNGHCLCSSLVWCISLCLTST